MNKWAVRIVKGIGPVIDQDGKHVATVHQVTQAALIAAAPQLLAALKRAVDAGIGSDGRRPSAADEADAAIAAAGKQS